MEHEFGYFVDDNAIKYREPRRGGYWDKVIVPKEVFVVAYNKWIKANDNTFIGQDDADDWSED